LTFFAAIAAGIYVMRVARAEFAAAVVRSNDAAAHPRRRAAAGD
jgi:hypothetical protein